MIKVLVKVSGFYAGNYHEAGAVVDMHEKVAKPFKAPFGEQLVSAPPKPAPKAGKAD